MTKVAPSLLSANFANLSADIDMVNKTEAAYYHIDVMDGVFVPNISYGFPVLKSIQRLVEKPFDVHLMIVEPDKFVNQVRDTGAEIMNVHQEACIHLHRTVQRIREAGMKAGVTLNPATPVETLEDIACDLDIVMLMGVNPGFGGQKFLDNQMAKVRRLRDEITRRGLKTKIQVDGGVSPKTAHIVAEAGADVLVAGSAVYGAENPAEAIDSIREKAEAAFKA